MIFVRKFSSCSSSYLFNSLIFRSEIAWRDAKYAQIYEYLREEYEVTQRFGNLDFKLKFVEVKLSLCPLLMHMFNLVVEF